jgi:DNA-binding SARP family transcriptional activator
VGLRFTAVLPRLTDSSGRAADDKAMNTNRPSIDLSLHGYPGLSLDGRPVALPLKRGLALIAFLSAHARPVGRDALAALLWPEAPPGRGRGRLRRLVHEVHAALGVELIDASADALWLRAGVSSDWQRTTAAIEAADAARLAEPLASQFLAGFTLDSDAFEDWLEGRRREQLAAVRSGLERAIGPALDAGRFDDAERAAEALLRLEPCAEGAHIARIEARARRADAAGVESAYFEGAQRWREELGLRPSARIEAAYARALATLRSAEQASPIARGRLGDGPAIAWLERLAGANCLMWQGHSDALVGAIEALVARQNPAREALAA